MLPRDDDWTGKIFGQKDWSGEKISLISQNYEYCENSRIPASGVAMAMAQRQFARLGAHIEESLPCSGLGHHNICSLVEEVCPT